MAKGIIWARYSPQPNADEKDLVENQVADGRDWFAEHGHTLADVPGTEPEQPGVFYVKEYSGGLEDNAELQRAVNSLGRGWIIWARDWSRYYRNNHAMDGLAIDVARHRAALWSGREGKYESADPWRKFTTKLAWLLAELRLDEIRSNTSKGLHRRQRKGDRVSREPQYGYRLDETGPIKVDDAERPVLGKDGKTIFTRIMKDEQEQATIVRMLELHAAGNSLRKIGATLEGEGRKPRSAEKWEATTLAKIIRRELKHRANS